MPSFRFFCPDPKCSKGMTIKGMDKKAWNWDEQRQEYTQRFYVSCPCAKKVIFTEHVLENVNKLRAGTKNQAVRTTARLLDLSQLKILEPVRGNHQHE